MYLKSIRLADIGPIERLAYSFQFTDEENPKPLIFVGGNGAGKSIVLSHLVNPLLSAQQVAFQDAEIQQGHVFKVRSPHYIRNGATHSYSEVKFGDGFVSEETVLFGPKEEFVKSYAEPTGDNSFRQIKPGESSNFHSNVSRNPSAVRREFNENCVLYFPANRFEQPAWLNEGSLSSRAQLEHRPNIQGVSGRKIIVENSLSCLKNWLLDVIVDVHLYEGKTDQVQLSHTSQMQVIGHRTTGPCTTIWNAVNRLIQQVLRTGPNGRLGIGSRQQRNVAVMVGDDKELIHNIFQLSTGQTSLLSIALSIVRDFDLTPTSFSSLNDIKGVVIIDEIDSHQHAEMQSNLLPSLLRMFPKVQFVVTSHSPLFLLGMREEFGNGEFDIVDLPSGERIDVEQFVEFQVAFDAYRTSDVFQESLNDAITKSQLPVIFVEGDYDIRYIRKAASLMNMEGLLSSVSILDANGCGGLDKIWKSCHDRLSTALPRTIGLVYDCDVERSDSDRAMVKRRVIPSENDHPIGKGIENLFPKETIEKLRTSNPQFFDVTPSFEKQLRGSRVLQPEHIEINVDEKGNLCDWMCEHGELDDFASFNQVLRIIAEVGGVSCDSSVTSWQIDVTDQG